MILTAANLRQLLDAVQRIPADALSIDVNKHILYRRANDAKWENALGYDTTEPQEYANLRDAARLLFKFTREHDIRDNSGTCHCEVCIESHKLITRIA